eukprot:gnl/MRDRNA2_/MRDRNA2_36382_c0_seq1.p1 gnl/MRDRNA2_/MRDRNA2_36382_c0~~gnl/MRDRNA2_/MRDRNA2_36382_c0_seq1.p1  ORF type:complete len:256 (+),score=41.15 gnl/MRDRNA2_/MRDRNA2_36382_c0_seq1:90-857(+)
MGLWQGFCILFYDLLLLQLSPVHANTSGSFTTQSSHGFDQTQVNNLVGKLVQKFVKRAFHAQLHHTDLDQTASAKMNPTTTPAPRTYWAKTEANVARARAEAEEILTTRKETWACATLMLAVSCALAFWFLRRKKTTEVLEEAKATNERRTGEQCQHLLEEAKTATVENIQKWELEWAMNKHQSPQEFAQSEEATFVNEEETIKKAPVTLVKGEESIKNPASRTPEQRGPRSSSQSKSTRSYFGSTRFGKTRNKK